MIRNIDDIKAGTPATISYHTDARPAVVVKRTAKRVVIARVAVDESTRRRENENLAAGEMPVILADGDVSKVIEGTEETYTFYVNSEGIVGATRGDKTIHVRFGYSRERIDYKH